MPGQQDLLTVSHNLIHQKGSHQMENTIKHKHCHSELSLKFSYAQFKNEDHYIDELQGEIKSLG